MQNLQSSPTRIARASPSPIQCPTSRSIPVRLCHSPRPTPMLASIATMSRPCRARQSASALVLPMSFSPPMNRAIAYAVALEAGVRARREPACLRYRSAVRGDSDPRGPRGDVHRSATPITPRGSRANGRPLMRLTSTRSAPPEALHRHIVRKLRTKLLVSSSDDRCGEIKEGLARSAKCGPAMPDDRRPIDLEPARKGTLTDELHDGPLFPCPEVVIDADRLDDEAAWTIGPHVCLVHRRPRALASNQRAARVDRRATSERMPLDESRRSSVAIFCC